jgi:hypothetical protein
MEVPEVARKYTTHLFSIQGKCYLGEGAETRGTHRLAPAATLCCPRGGGKSAFEIPIHIHTAVLVPTLHNPIRLAEDIPMVDVVSNGRLDVGFGRGSAGYEYHGYGLDRTESQQRFQESIRMILGLWVVSLDSVDEYEQRSVRTLAVPS